MLKKALRFWDIVIEYNWYGWKDKSKIYLMIWIASVMIIIFLALGTWIAWLILYLIKNISVSVEVTLIAWWIILTRMFWPKQICNIKVVILFLILVLDITRIVFRFKRELLKILLRVWI